MNRVFPVAILLAAYGSGAFAACGGTRLTSAQINTAFENGVTINANSPTNENWNEIHCSTSGVANNLQKVGLGVGHAVDPQEKEGTWTVNAGDTITYDYGTGGSYTWRVYSTDGGVINFCWQANADAGATIATQTAVALQVPCI